jgi:predicted flap endonuclease-1-like 5' DNA nuclease
VVVVSKFDDDVRGFVEEGVRANLFDYSGKTILSVKHSELRYKAEDHRVKNMKTACLPWVIDGRAGRVFNDDIVTELKGVGPTKTRKLETFGITTVAEMKVISEDTITAIAGNIEGNRLSAKDMKAWKAEALLCTENKPRDLVVDHRRTDSPYKSLYGEDLYKEKLKKCSQFSMYVDIRDMIEHIVVQSKEVMKGTEHEDE